MIPYRTLDTLPPSLPLLYVRHEDTHTAATRLRDCWRTVWHRLPDSARGALRTIAHFRREWRLPGGSVYVRSRVEDIDTLPTTYARFNAPSSSYFFLSSFIHTLP